MNPFNVVKDFEAAVADYTGAPYVVAVNSCTNALFLCMMFLKDLGQLPAEIELPCRTYVSVPMQVMHAGSKPKFKDYNWTGEYQLGKTGIWDAARRFTSQMYGKRPFEFKAICTSHHWGKILGVQQGGCILHNSAMADVWFRRARFDGRGEGVHPTEDKFYFPGWHMYMSPEIAAEGLVRISHLRKHNPDLPMDNYPDLSKIEIFR